MFSGKDAKALLKLLWSKELNFHVLRLCAFARETFFKELISLTPKGDC
jgi:hypothetical protein